MAKKMKKEADFQHGNLKDRRIDPRSHSVPAATRFTEPDQNANVKQGKPRME